MNNGESKGTVYSSPLSELMAAYDRLPPTVRQALGEAVFEWHPVTVEKYYARYGTRKTILRLAALDQETLSANYADKEYARHVTPRKKSR